MLPEVLRNHRKGTDMPLDPSAVGTKGDPVDLSWDSKDCLLYAVGIGAGADELAFTTENTTDVGIVAMPV